MCLQVILCLIYIYICIYVCTTWFWLIYLECGRHGSRVEFDKPESKLVVLHTGSPFVCPSCHTHNHSSELARTVWYPMYVYGSQLALTTFFHRLVLAQVLSSPLLKWWCFTLCTRCVEMASFLPTGSFSAVVISRLHQRQMQSSWTTSARVRKKWLILRRWWQTMAVKAWGQWARLGGRKSVGSLHKVVQL